VISSFCNVQLSVDVLNIFDKKNNDVSYFYTSRLPGEHSEGVDDFHIHPAEPRTFRVSALQVLDDPAALFLVLAGASAGPMILT